MAKGQTEKHHKFFGSSKTILEKICSNVSGIENWQGGVINSRDRKKHLDIKIFSDKNRKNIVLRFYEEGGSQDYYLLRKPEIDLDKVLAEVVACIQNYDSNLKIVYPDQKIIQKIKKGVDKEQEENPVMDLNPPVINDSTKDQARIDPIISGLVLAHEILDKCSDCIGKDQLRILLDLIEKDSKGIENAIDSIFALMSLPTPKIDCQTAVFFLQKQIKYLESVKFNLQKEIQANSENEVCLKSACEKIAKDIEAMMGKQNKLSADEKELREAIQKFVAEGNYGEISELLEKAKNIKSELERLPISLAEETTNLAKTEEEKTVLKNILEIFKAKKSAVEQDINWLQKACKVLSRSIHEVFAKIESRPVSTEISELETPPEEPAPTPPADSPTDNIFAGYSEKEKQLLLGLEAKGKFAGLGSQNTYIVEQLSQRGIPKSQSIANAARGLMALGCFFEQIGIKSATAKKFIESLQKTGVLDNVGKINFEIIKKLLSDKRKYTPKKETRKQNITPRPFSQSTLQTKKNGRGSVSFKDGRSIIKFEAD